MAALGLRCRTKGLLLSCGARTSLHRLLWWTAGSRRVGFVVMVLGLSCSKARRSFLDKASNLCPLHWQMDSYSLDHQGRFYVLVSIQAEHRSEETALGSKDKSTVWALLKVSDRISTLVNGRNESKQTQKPAEMTVEEHDLQIMTIEYDVSILSGPWVEQPNCKKTFLRPLGNLFIDCALDESKDYWWQCCRSTMRTCVQSHSVVSDSLRPQGL